MMKEKVRVPGSLAKKVVILDGPEVRYGLIKLRNIGEYGIGVGGLDAKGNLMQPHLYLNPGEAVASFMPPANAVKIILMGEKADPDNPLPDDETELEYDVPWYS